MIVFAMFSKDSYHLFDAFLRHLTFVLVIDILAA